MHLQAPRFPKCTMKYNWYQSCKRHVMSLYILKECHPKTAILSSSDTRWGGLISRLWTENLLIIKPSSHRLSAWGLNAAAEGSAPKLPSSEVQTSHQGRNPGWIIIQSIISMLSTQEQGEQPGFSQNNQKD